MIDIGPELLALVCAELADAQTRLANARTPEEEAHRRRVVELLLDVVSKCSPKARGFR